MLVLFLFSTLTLPNGKPFQAPIGVEDESLEAFVERLNAAGVVTVAQLSLTAPDRDGVQHIRDSWPIGLGVSAIGTLVNNRYPVCITVDGEAA